MLLDLRISHLKARGRSLKPVTKQKDSFIGEKFPNNALAHFSKL